MSSFADWDMCMPALDERPAEEGERMGFDSLESSSEPFMTSSMSNESTLRCILRVFLGIPCSSTLMLARASRWLDAEEYVEDVDKMGGRLADAAFEGYAAEVQMDRERAGTEGA